jgi:hypothetical protein
MAGLMLLQLAAFFFIFALAASAAPLAQKQHAAYPVE